VQRKEGILLCFQNISKVSDRLAAIERSILAVEEQKADFERRLEDMEKRKGSRSRLREEQLVTRKLRSFLYKLLFVLFVQVVQRRREDEKKKEQEEFAQFQAEQKRKLDEKHRARDIKSRAAKGMIPKLRLGLVGPKSGIQQTRVKRRCLCKVRFLYRKKCSSETFYGWGICRGSERNGD
jgi:hypothetical protein